MERYTTFMDEKTKYYYNVSVHKIYPQIQQNFQENFSWILSLNLQDDPKIHMEIQKTYSC